MSEFELPENVRQRLDETQRTIATTLASSLEPLLEQHRRAIAAAMPGIERFLEQYRQALAALQPQLDQIGEQARKSILPALQVLEAQLRLVPRNLAVRYRDLDALWAIAVSEGVPICWIPRPEILDDLLAAGSPGGRLALLVDRRTEILADCDAVLRDIDAADAATCLEVVAASAAGLHGPAQSHAGNIIDSFVLRVGGGASRFKRSSVAAYAEAGYRDDDGLRQTFDVIALAPIVAALTQWFPGDPAPMRFNRHATAHVAGHPGVFTEAFSIVAVMAAVSITRHFHDHVPDLSGTSDVE